LELELNTAGTKTLVRLSYQSADQAPFFIFSSQDQGHRQHRNKPGFATSRPFEEADLEVPFLSRMSGFGLLGKPVVRVYQMSSECGGMGLVSNSNSNSYKPILNNPQCCGLKWVMCPAVGARALRIKAFQGIWGRGQARWALGCVCPVSHVCDSVLLKMCFFS